MEHEVPWDNAGSGLCEQPGTSPGGVLHCLVSLCGSQGTLGGSDGSWPLPRRGPASPGSAAEPGMARVKG